MKLMLGLYEGYIYLPGFRIEVLGFRVEGLGF